MRNNYLQEIREEYSRSIEVLRWARNIQSALDYVDYCRKNLDEAIQKSEKNNDK